MQQKFFGISTVARARSVLPSSRILTSIKAFRERRRRMGMTFEATRWRVFLTRQKYTCSRIGRVGSIFNLVRTLEPLGTSGSQTMLLSFSKVRGYSFDLGPFQRLLQTSVASSKAKVSWEHLFKATLKYGIVSSLCNLPHRQIMPFPGSHYKIGENRFAAR